MSRNEIVMQFTRDNVRQVFRAMFDRVSGTEKAMEIAVRERRRSIPQNAKMWPMLTDVAKQVQLCINGKMVWAQPEDWKDVFTAALRREQRMAQGIDGGIVVLGAHTSKMSKAEFADLIEIIYAFGAEKSVVWSEPALSAYEQWGKLQREQNA